MTAPNRYLPAVAACVLLAATAGCSRDTVLGVDNPDIVDPASLNSPDGADGLRVGALKYFKFMTAADESSWFYGGLLVDEWKSSDTFTQRDEADQRSVTEQNALVTVAYRDIHRARIQAFQAVASLQKWQPTAKAKIGEMFFVKGYAELQSSLDFCNGQPFADLSSGSAELGVPVSGADAAKLALASFDSALTYATATDSISQRVLYSAQVGRGQRLGDLRREIRVYQRPVEQVFPGQGAINPRKNSPYGADVNLPVPQAERNNAKFGGCTDRSA